MNYIDIDDLYIDVNGNGSGTATVDGNTADFYLVNDEPKVYDTEFSRAEEYEIQSTIQDILPDYLDNKIDKINIEKVEDLGDEVYEVKGTLGNSVAGIKVEYDRYNDIFRDIQMSNLVRDSFNMNLGREELRQEVKNGIDNYKEQNKDNYDIPEISDITIGDGHEYAYDGGIQQAGWGKAEFSNGLIASFMFKGDELGDCDLYYPYEMRNINPDLEDKTDEEIEEMVDGLEEGLQAGLQDFYAQECGSIEDIEITGSQGSTLIFDAVVGNELRTEISGTLEKIKNDWEISDAYAEGPISLLDVGKNLEKTLSYEIKGIQTYDPTFIDVAKDENGIYQFTGNYENLDEEFNFKGTYNPETKEVKYDSKNLLNPDKSTINAESIENYINTSKCLNKTKNNHKELINKDNKKDKNQNIDV